MADAEGSADLGKGFTRSARRLSAAQRSCANFVKNSSRKFLFLEALCCCWWVAAPHTNV
jgi:hypothetical protein